MIRWTIFFYFVGLLLVCIEVFIPGGVVGFIGLAAIATSFFLAFTKIGTAFGGYFMGMGFVLLTVALYICFRFVPKTRMAKFLFLKSTEKGFTGTSEARMSVLLGQIGTALTPLRPSGMAHIAGQRVNVVTDGTFVDKDMQVKVTKVEGNRVIVRGDQAA